MKVPSSRFTAPGACAVILAAIVITSSLPAVAEKGVPQASPTLSPEQALAFDAATIAAAEGTTPAMAEAAIVRQAAIGEVIPTVEAILGSANAGVSVDIPEVSTTLHVRVTGSLSEAAAAELQDVADTLRPAGVTIKVTEGVEHSLAELTAAAESLPTGSGEILGVGVDVVNNDLVADVTRIGAVSEAVASAPSEIRVRERLVTSS